MILQSLILAIACTGAFNTGQNNYTLTYNVGRGLCTDVVLYQDNGNDLLYYSNVYFDFDNVRCTYSEGNLTGIYCDAIYFTTDEYYVDETFFQSRSFTMSNLSDDNLLSGFYFDSVYGSYYGDDCLRILLYVGDNPIRSIFIPYPSQIDVIHTKTEVSFLEKNFVDYYDLYAGNFSYSKGYDRGYTAGLGEGETIGYNNGYVDGYNDAFNGDSTALTIFSGITTIAMLPVDMFLRMFNFEVLGINLTSFITGLLTFYIVLYMLKVVTGSRSKGD